MKEPHGGLGIGNQTKLNMAPDWSNHDLRDQGPVVVLCLNVFVCFVVKRLIPRTDFH